MIALDRMGRRAFARFIGWGVTLPNHSPAVEKYLISKEWRKLCAASSVDEQCRCAVLVILSALAFIHYSGCSDIESLIWEVLKCKNYHLASKPPKDKNNDLYYPTNK